MFVDVVDVTSSARGYSALRLDLPDPKRLALALSTDDAPPH